MSRRAKFFLLLAALALRVGYVLAADDWRQPVTFEYGEIASHLLAGEGFSARPFLPLYGRPLVGPLSPTAYMAPGYVWLLAGSQAAFGAYGYLALQLLQAVASALVCLLVAEVAERLFERRVAPWAGWLAALYPMLIYYCRIMQPTVFTALAAALAVVLLLRLAERPNWGLVAACGAALGLGILIEPVLLGFLPLALGWLAWRGGLSRAAAVGALACLLLAPWTARNWVVFHRFVPVKSTFSLNLWLGNNPLATGYEYGEGGLRIKWSLSAEERARLAAMNEADAFSYLGGRALAFMRANPGLAARLAAAKLYYFWWVSPLRRGLRVHGEHGGAYLWLRKLVLAGLLASAAAGLALGRPRWSQALLPALLGAAFSLTYALTYAAHSRFKVPLEPLLLAFSAGGLAWLAGALRAGQTGAAGVSPRGQGAEP